MWDLCLPRRHNSNCSEFVGIRMYRPNGHEVQVPSYINAATVRARGREPVHPVVRRWLDVQKINCLFISVVALPMKTNESGSSYLLADLG